MKRLTVGEEVFIAVRELRRGELARWSDFAKAWASMSRSAPHSMNMTISNFIRGQCFKGALKRVSKGRYAFVKLLPARPMYLAAYKLRLAMRGTHKQ